MNFLTKNWKQIAVWAAFGIVGWIIYKYLTNRMQKNAPEIPAVTEQGEQGTFTPSFQYDPQKVDRKKLFGYGSKESQETAYLQTWLNAYYKSGLKIDGDFGNKTLSAWKLAKPTAPTLSFSLNEAKI